MLHGELDGSSTHWLHEGNVIFYIVLSGEKAMSREEIARVLVEVQVLYLNHIFGPREIESADVTREGSGRMLATFQIFLVGLDGQRRAGGFSPRIAAP